VRVGVPGESLYREHALDGEIRSALETAAGVLRGSGAIVRRVEMPEPARWQAIVNVILSEAYEYHAERLRSEPEKFSVGLRQLLYALAPYTASDYIRAQRLRRVIAEEMRELFRAIDVILMPVEFYLPITFAESHAELAAGARPPSLRHTGGGPVPRRDRAVAHRRRLGDVAPSSAGRRAAPAERERAGV